MLVDIYWELWEVNKQKNNGVLAIINLGFFRITQWRLLSRNVMLFRIIASYYYCISLLPVIIIVVSRKNASPVINALDVRTNDDDGDDRTTFAII